MTVTLKTLVSFNHTNGDTPQQGSLILDGNGDLFGTTELGGALTSGTVFEIVKTDSGYASAPTTLVNFTLAGGGVYPFGSLIADADGNLFGTTSSSGGVFEIAKTDSGYASTATILAPINSYAGLIADANGNLFGTTYNGGANGLGTVFEIAKTASGYSSVPTILVSFNAGTGNEPYSRVTADANGNLFGTTSHGGANGLGTVFEIVKTADGYASTPTVLVSASGGSGANAGIGQLHDTLIADADGNLFGTTSAGGERGYGTVFEIVKTANGYASTPTILVSFKGTNGVSPIDSLIIDAAGNLFGATYAGGTTGYGTAFKIAKTANGYASDPTVLVNFTSSNAHPSNTLIADSDGNLFGTTVGGAVNYGTVFEITGSGFVVARPAVTITGISPDNGASASDGLTSAATVTINGRIDVTNAQRTISVYDGATLVGTTTASSGGFWSLAGVTLAQGTNSLTAQATNSQGTATSPAFTATLDATPPSIVSVGASPTSGTEHLGQTVTLVLSFSEAMRVSGGTPTLTLNDGGTATYDAAATAALGDPSKLAFSYTVGASDTPVDVLAVVDHSLNGATIADLAGNAPDYSGLSATLPGLTIRPTAVTAVLASPVSGVESIGQTITLTLVFNQSVAVSGGTPTLTLNNGGTAVYDSAATAALSDPTRMVFSYTVAASDSPVNGLAIVRGDQNGSAIVDAAGHGPDFAAAFTNFPAIQVPSGAAVISVTASPTGGAEHVGDTITFTIGMDRAVTVTGGTPTLKLSNNGTATYDAAATAALGDPTKLVFSYTVAASDGSANGLYVAFGGQNGAAILDSTGLASDFSAAATSFPGIQVDALAPATVTSFVASPSSAIEHPGNTVVFTMTLSAAVTVSGGTPTLALNNGGTAIYDATVTAALGDATKLVFKYTVSDSDLTASGLAVVSGNTNGANIVDASGQGPDFSGAFTNFPSIGVRTPATTIASFAASPSSGTEQPGDVITLTFTMSRAVTITGGTPTLTLNDGGIAIYDAGATAALGDPTKLVFNYAVSADYNVHNVDSLAVVKGDQNGAVIVDGSGRGPDFSAMTTPFANLAVKIGIDLADIAFGPSTTLGYAANENNSGGLLTVGDGTHSSVITLLGQYAAADFHAWSDFHGGTLITDPGLTGHLR